ETGVANATVFDKAKQFLLVCQKNPADKRKQPLIRKDDTRPVYYDGGFYYSPIITAADKGKMDSADAKYQPYIRSYATATCDGLLGLLAAGYSVNDEQVKAAIKWLEDHPRLD